MSKASLIPVAVSAFPDELYPAPRTSAAGVFPKLIHYNRLPKGGHFAALEQPQLFSEEVRVGFRPLRLVREGWRRVRGARRLPIVHAASTENSW